jgi:hypothetical protein
MGWVNDLMQQRMAEQAMLRPTAAPEWSASERQSIPEKITRQIQSDVFEFNGARGPQFRVSTSGDSMVTVTPKQPPLSTAVVEVDRAGIINMTCPPAGPGIGRRGTFKEKNERIVSLGYFVGIDQPPSEPMTPEEFSRFVLEPIFFSASQSECGHQKSHLHS